MQIFWQLIVLTQRLFPEEKQVKAKADYKLTVPYTTMKLDLFS